MKRPSLSAILGGLLAGSAFALAVSRVWVADDAYITFRHVMQLLAGNGLTFNTLERVEGFTHPVWALLLAFFGLLGAPLSGVAVTLNLLFTALLLLLVLRAEAKAGPLAMALLVSCSGFVDFATSGLETPLTLFLVFIAYLDVARGNVGARTGVCLSLAYLCHPDVAVLGAGPALLVLARLRREGLSAGVRRAVRFFVSLGAAPLAWHAFRLAYYGVFWPNTYYAKNGGAYWSQGFVYILDFIHYAPVSALALPIAAGLGLLDTWRPGSDPARFGRLAGVGAVVLHGVAIARVGGDFMGFRLLLPDLAAAAALCAGELGRLRPGPRRAAELAFAGAGLFSLFVQPIPPHERNLIMNERLNFAYAFKRPSDAFTGHPRHAWWSGGRLVRSLQECIVSPDLIVEFPNIGYYGVALGPRVSLIDSVGLVDPFVARNWAARAGRPRERPGHEGKMTLEYEVARGIHFVPETFEPYRSTMQTDYGVLLSFDPGILCALPGKAEALRRLKTDLQAKGDARALDTLAFLARLEKRDGVSIETVCRDAALMPTPRDCSPAGMNRARRGEEP